MSHPNFRDSGHRVPQSRLPLQKWFWAIYLISTSKKGVSALYLQKQLKLGSYNTAWMMMQKIRLAMANRDEQYTLGGLVSADEIHIGGKQKMKELQEKGTNCTLVKTKRRRVYFSL